MADQRVPSELLRDRAWTILHEADQAVDAVLKAQAENPKAEPTLGFQRMLQARLGLAHEFGQLAAASAAVENPEQLEQAERFGQALRSIRELTSTALHGGTVMAGWDTVREVDEIARVALA